MEQQWEDVQFGAQLTITCKDNLFLSEEAIIERYQIEKKLARLVEDGDYVTARRLLDSMPQYQESMFDFVARTHNEDERLRNLGLLMNSGLRMTLLNIDVPISIIHGIATYFGRMINYGSLELLKSDRLFDSMLKTYCGIAKAFSGKSYSPTVEKIVEYIVINITSSLSLKQISDHFNYSPVHVNRLLKQETGYSTIQFIKQKRISLAKALMGFGNMPMEKIAAEVGYPDYNYFCRVFRQVENMSPSKYLEMSRDE